MAQIQKKQVAKLIDALMKDYSQGFSQEWDEARHVINRITELVNEFPWARQEHLDKAYNEMLVNYSYYRKVCVASFMNAFYRANDASAKSELPDFMKRMKKQ